MSNLVLLILEYGEAKYQAASSDLSVEDRRDEFYRAERLLNTIIEKLNGAEVGERRA